jgi:hypothetical protein
MITLMRPVGKEASEIVFVPLHGARQEVPTQKAEPKYRVQEMEDGKRELRCIKHTATPSIPMAGIQHCGRSAVVDSSRIQSRELSSPFAWPQAALLTAPVWGQRTSSVLLVDHQRRSSHRKMTRRLSSTNGRKPIPLHIPSCMKRSKRP